jgi:hypothetical protein
MLVSWSIPPCRSLKCMPWTATSRLSRARPIWAVMWARYGFRNALKTPISPNFTQFSCIFLTHLFSQLATKQLGLLADYLVSVVGAITVERPENSGIMTFTETYQNYDDCTDVFSVVMFAARQTRKTMGIQEDDCAMEIDENSQPMDGDTYIPTPSKNKKSKKNIVDGEAMPALVFDADGNPMSAEKPTPWHLKDKKFIRAFKVN